MEPLTPGQLAELKIHVGAAGWATYELLPQANRVDPAAALAVYGDLRLVAAAILDDLAARAPTVTKIKVGQIEATLGSRVADWRARAADLRGDAAQQGEAPDGTHFHLIEVGW